MEWLTEKLVNPVTWNRGMPEAALKLHNGGPGSMTWIISQKQLWSSMIWIRMEVQARVPRVPSSQCWGLLRAQQRIRLADFLLTDLGWFETLCRKEDKDIRSRFSKVSKTPMLVRSNISLLSTASSPQFYNIPDFQLFHHCCGQARSSNILFVQRGEPWAM